MSGSPHNMESLWKRLEDAKLQLDHCHNYVREIMQDNAAGALPVKEGNLAYRHALKADELAVKTYFRTLNDFKAALPPPGELLPNAPANAGDPGAFRITPREREVLSLIASGKSSKQIAAELRIAFRTVVCHRYRLQTKLKVHNTADLTRIAVRMGLAQV